MSITTLITSNKEKIEIIANYLQIDIKSILHFLNNTFKRFNVQAFDPFYNYKFSDQYYKLRVATEKLSKNQHIFTKNLPSLLAGLDRIRRKERYFVFVTLFAMMLHQDSRFSAFLDAFIDVINDDSLIQLFIHWDHRVGKIIPRFAGFQLICSTCNLKRYLSINAEKYIDRIGKEL